MVEEVNCITFGKIKIMKNILFLSSIILFTFSVSAQRQRTKSESTSKKTDYGKNILSFSPIQIILSDNEQSEPDVAINFAYERIFNNDIISFKLPVSFSLEQSHFYIMPTLKLYPTGQGLAKYSVGPQFLFATGDANYNTYTQNQSGSTIVKINSITRKQFGFLIDNCINFTVAKALYVGLNAGLGIIYYDNLPKDNYYYNSGITPFGNNNSNISPAFQLNFNMGYRF